MTKELREQVTEEEFLKVFLIQPLFDKQITTSLTIDAKIITVDFMTKSICNCVFDEEVVFKNFDTALLLRIENCVFNKEVRFENFKSKNKTIRFYNSEILELHFDNCNISILSIADTKKTESIVNEINFNESKINNLEIVSKKIRRVTFLSQKNEYLNIYGFLRLENTDILNWFWVENVEIIDLGFYKGEFNNSWDLKEVIIRNLSFNEVLVKKEMSLHNQDNIQNIRIENSEFKKDFGIRTKIRTENEEDIKALDSLSLSKCKFEGEFLVKDVILNNLEINASSKLTGNYKFRDSDISLLTLNGTENKANLTFDQCRFNKVKFDQFRTDEDLVFSGVRSYGVDSEFTIKGSRLGKTLFSNVHLESFNKINIEGSMIQEINTTGIEWFHDTQLNIVENKKAEDWKKDREVFRQIKQSLEKQGSNIDALTFKAYEMNAYKKEKGGETKSWKWSTKINNSVRIFGDNLILVAGWTNDFGLSWTRALGLAILSCILFFVILSLTLMPKVHFQWSINPYDLRYFDSLPNLFNPVLSIDKVFIVKNPEDIEIGFEANLFFLLHRIVLSFFIFQIISAFRKYVK